ncbi:MAG TPA: hypothetical protein VMR18_04325 [Candidatus Saccharimonadales bacterium]|jgi:hypothetical protein|nr:hypothetical protein [Candidatus Saccharimonadales bacterium]
MLNKVLIASAAIIILMFGLVLNDHQSQRVNLTSNDVSWPNCGDSAIVNSPTGIIGVNGGLDFRLNPCPNKEASWFANYALYINTGYPGNSYGKKYLLNPKKCQTSDSQCLAYNWGYNATKYSIDYADSEGIHSPLWWLDVETDNSWTSSIGVNRASILGAIDAINHYVFMPKIGIYSDDLQWNTLVGSWNLRLPTWTATGASTRSVAKESCSEKSFDNGAV